MPSGRFSWNVLDRLDNRVAGGLAHTYREARKRAMAAELAQPIHKMDTRVDPSFTFRHRKECGI